jgi:hypothetical protein
VPDFNSDLSLLMLVLLNTAVFTSAWFFASRRITANRSQALLDAGLLGYAVQYVSVGLPGLSHYLTPSTIAAVALACSICLFAAARKARPGAATSSARLDRLLISGVGLFTLAFVLIFAHSQAGLPVISNDAMTYHFPAAVQWLQDAKINLFQTWFFNPANTYSPLAGSVFIVWLIAPFHSDVIARFVEVPALICVGIAMYRLCNQLGAKPPLAALIAAAATLARPIFLPGMMGKDDLFVAFFFLAALVAMAPDRSGERFGALRFGIALGLLLATKYSALLSVPILLLAIDGPRWRWRGWISALGIAVLLAGPWYLRNWILTGNPLFPMFSLFTTAQSDAFHPSRHASAVLLDGAYGLPASLAAVLAIPWLRSAITSSRSLRSDALLRACALGVPVGLLIFYAESPFPEVRFVLPVFLLLFACSACWLGRLRIATKLQLLPAIPLPLLSIITVFGFIKSSVALSFAAESLILALIGLAAFGLTRNRPLRSTVLLMTTLIVSIAYTYIHWSAYCRDTRESIYDEGGGYAVEYPDPNRLWRFVNENIPADATVAYTNAYLIYPLQGPLLNRRLIYVPTRPGIKTIADLGWLGRHLSGEKLIPAALRATVAAPDRATWLANLQTSGAGYLVIGQGGVIGIPPEDAFAAADPRKFHPLFEGPAGKIYRIESRHSEISTIPPAPEILPVANGAKGDDHKPAGIGRNS